jgi:branched-chain amino acid transport system substrate-binding protein
MNKTYTFFVIAILAILTIVGGTFFNSNQTPTNSQLIQSKNIKLGFVGSLTGEAASYGQAMLSATKIAVNEFQTQNPSYKVELVAEDDKCDKDASVNATNKLVDIDKVQALVGYTCSTASAVALPNVKNIPVVISCASSPTLTGIGNNIYRTAPSDSVNSPNAAKAIFDNLKSKNVGVIYSNEPFGQNASKIFQTEFQKLGGEVSILEILNKGDINFGSLVQKIQDSKAEYYYMPSLPSYALPLLKQLKDSSVNIKIVSDTLALDGESIKTGLIEGVYTATARSNMTPQFASSIKSMSGFEAGVCDPYTYDATQLILESIKTNPSNPITEFSKANFVGQGGQVKFGPDREMLGFQYDLKQIVNGKLENVK